MASSAKVVSSCTILLLIASSFVKAVPIDDPATIVESAQPAVVAAPDPAPVPPQVAPATPQAPPAPPVQDGNGYTTHQKNPDGSTITITKWNGPIPANAFPHGPIPYGGGPYGYGFPFAFPWGFPGATRYEPAPAPVATPPA